MVGLRKVVSRYVLHELLLHFQRCVSRAWHESETMTHTENVRVDWHRCLAERHSQHHVSRLAPYAWQAQQTVEVVRHFAPVLALYHASQLDEVARLGVRITHTLHVFVHLKLVGFCHRACVGIVGEEFGRHLIDTLVGALRTEHNGNEQLEHAAKLQFGSHFWMDAAEVVEHIFI